MWVYKDKGAILEWALLNYFIQEHLRDGYTFLLPPHILNAESGYAAGQLPKFKDDAFPVGKSSSDASHFLLPTAQIADALKVAGIVGKIIAERATFAGSVAGCAVEAGSAAAMAAAGLAYIMDEKSVEAPFSAAALCLMNNSGLVCDPVKGEVEVPCHARNIAGVGHAFTAATASIGGFNSYIPFDEVVDSMLEVGKTIPPSLRCTSQGGLATCPTACGS